MHIGIELAYDSRSETYSLINICIFFDLNFTLMGIVKVDLKVHLFITFNLCGLFCLCLLSKVIWINGLSSKTLN